MIPTAGLRPPRIPCAIQSATGPGTGLPRSAAASPKACPAGPVTMANPPPARSGDRRRIAAIAG